jgi:hypothetical protein
MYHVFLSRGCTAESLMRPEIIPGRSSGGESPLSDRPLLAVSSAARVES